MYSDDDHKNLLQEWSEEQQVLRQRMIMEDVEPWQFDKLVYKPGAAVQDRKGSLRYVAGLDISFDKKSQTRACAGLVVLDISDSFRVVYQDVSIVRLDLPYISGFLAYREAPFLLEKLSRLKREQPELYPQCIVVDGNGMFHVNKFGAACHIGVLSGTPTVGVSKKLHQIFGYENGAAHKRMVEERLSRRGDHFEMLSDDDAHELVAYCYRSTDGSTRPIYISLGNMISWQTCLWVIENVTGECRIPEPVRVIDRLTREYLRE